MQNPFTAPNPFFVSSVPHSRREAYSNSKAAARLNPFNRQSLILAISKKSESVSTRSANFSVLRQVCSSISSTKSCRNRKYQQNISRLKLVSSEEVSQKLLKQRQKFVQVKRVALFGPQILRYQSIERTNTDYFSKNIQLKNSKNRDVKCVFSQSAGLYYERSHTRNNVNGREEQNDQNKHSRVPAKNSKLKMKKTLSWNTELEHQTYEKEVNSQRAIPRATKNQTKNFTFANINLSQNSEYDERTKIRASLHRQSNDYIMENRNQFDKVESSSSIDEDLMANHKWVQRNNMKHSSVGFQITANPHNQDSKLKENKY